MGNTQAPTVELRSCELCLSRYQRERQSVCMCNHCPLRLCSECMNDHIEELPQNITQLPYQFHELEQLFEKKQNMVQAAVVESPEEII